MTMGPLVPDIITDELNLIFGFLVGIAFGFVLEQAGFSSSRKLTGLFYGTDFTVLRVFFTASVTAMCGVIVLSNLGLLDTDLIFIHPTYLYSAVLGGVIMGVGFVVGGYCPGTSFCGAAAGKIDAIVFVAGGFVGVLAFGEAFPLLEPVYVAGSLGDLTVHTVLGITPGQFAAILIVAAVGAFVVAARVERKVNPASSLADFPVLRHRVVAAAVIVLGFTLAGWPDYKTRRLEQASDATFQRENPVKRMTADELAFRILDRDPSLVLIDVRGAAAFSAFSLPGAVNLPAESLFGNEPREVLAQSRKKKLFFADDETTAVRAATLARLLGYENVAALQGGLDEFKASILLARTPDRELTRGEQDTYRFRVKAGPQLAALIRERGTPKPAEKRTKRIAAGCGT